jgi:gamma-glutamyl-gamma-aminobutyrate hydrolase PuuD
MTLGIGITCSFNSWPVDEGAQTRLTNYKLAVEDAGARGEFLLLGENEPENAEKLAAQLDALLLSGGADLPTEMYGEAPRDNANLELVTPARPALEFALVDAFVRRGKPVLGICYGCQFLNVWAGGGLLQDIELQWQNPVPHRNARHTIDIAPGSALARLVGPGAAEVNSFHHQGIAQAAPRGKAVAKAPDGIIEAVEFGSLEPGEFVLGVQWHPERDRDALVTQKLFAAFVKSCR